MDNLDSLSIMFAFTCAVGDFSIPGHQCLAEWLVMHPSGGMVAVYSPTGLSDNQDARELDALLLFAFFDHLRLGDALVDAIGQYYQWPEGAGYIPDIYALLGDPATGSAGK